MQANNHFIERDRPTDSPYSYPFVVNVFKTSEKYGLFRYFRKLPHFVTRFFATIAGVFLFNFGPWKKQVGKNLDIIFKGKIKKKYGKKMERKIANSIAFINAKSMARNFIENLFTLTSLTVYKDYYKDVIKWEGDSLKRIIDAWKLGKGVVCISIHAGCPEILTTALGHYRRGGEIPSKAKASIPTEKGSVDAYIKYMNRVVGMLEMGQDEGVDRKAAAIDVIKRKQILMLAIDRGHKNYPIIPIFDKPARSPIGPAFMYVKYGSPILPAYIVPHPKKSQWTIFVDDPLKLKDNHDGLSERELIVENSKIVNKALEKIILKTYPNWLYLILFHKLKGIEIKK
ncbi:MAG: hypothetical protein EAX96_16915 [Candidatus Lokiarchaeota archaeon]|nr:hypothetical protein [Candidatus Lokiarchaeota archaeon]